jgi:two-component system, cell cycle response regulator DivK
LYAFYLNHVGYHVTVALDGETAIRLAQQQRFDIIVMDLAMPKMDGVEATRCLKTDERTRQIPIIIVSGHAMHGLAGAARAAGAEGYCMKPCSPEALEREIERVLAGGAAPRPD